MDIKDKIKRRIELVRDYKAAVSYYREMQRKYERVKNRITVPVDEEQVNDVVACMKLYMTELPDFVSFDASEKYYPQTVTCEHFNEKKCSVFNCPFYIDNMQYKNYQLLLSQARNNKKSAWHMMFQRIR